MSIAGGLFNSNNKEEKGGDTKTTADGDATSVPDPVDLTTSLPGFEDDTDAGLVIGSGGAVWDVDAGTPRPGNVDVEGVTDATNGSDFDVDSADDVRLDPES